MSEVPGPQYGQALPPPPPPPPPLSEAAKPRWYGRRWVQMVIVGVVALSIGGAVGAGSPPDPKQSSAYQNQTKQLDAATDDATAAKSDAADAQSQAASAQASAAAVEGTLPSREAALKSGQADLASGQKDLQDAIASEKASEADLKSREKKFDDLVKRTEDNAIDEGVYEVGRDMAPGEYRSSGPEGCYWQISSDPNGENIINNDNVDGPAIVQVSSGQFFESERCDTWILQP